MNLNGFRVESGYAGSGSNGCDFGFRSGSSFGFGIWDWDFGCALNLGLILSLGESRSNSRPRSVMGYVYVLASDLFSQSLCCKGRVLELGCI